MKRHLSVFVLICSFLWVGEAQTKLSTTTFNASETLTAGKIFMNQVDAVSLYLTTEHVVYVPRLTSDMHLNVGVTLIGMDFGGDQETMRSFVMRHISTFNKALMERLQYYTPKLAKEFDPSKDEEFVIKVGAEQQTVAMWKEGSWNWIRAIEDKKQKADNSKQDSANTQPVSGILEEEGEGRCKKKCPALVGGSKIEQPH